MSTGQRAPCMFLGPQVCGSKHQCVIWGECAPTPVDDAGIVWCGDCEQYGTPEQPPREQWQDPLVITDRQGQPTDVLRNMLGGGAAFLVCGGPSLNDIPREALAERGVYSLGINNAAAHVPVSAFTASDPPMKFHHGIFEDPKIMKFLPKPKLAHGRGQLRMRGPDGKLVASGRTTAQCPNVWGYERRSWLSPDETWFTETSAAWGNHKEGVAKTGEPKTVCTMLLGMRILQYLGARTIFLLGVDFAMSPARGETGNYAFGEQKHADACGSNNEQYAVVNRWLIQLRPVFERFGFQVFNCNPRSHLRAFDYVPFDEALPIVRGRVPAGAWDLQGWYEK